MCIFAAPGLRPLRAHDSVKLLRETTGIEVSCYLELTFEPVLYILSTQVNPLRLKIVFRMISFKFALLHPPWLDASVTGKHDAVIQWHVFRIVVFWLNIFIGTNYGSRGRRVEQLLSMLLDSNSTHFEYVFHSRMTQ